MSLCHPYPCQALGKLDLSQNLLTGSVLLGSLRRIKQLSLRGNLLSGTIPPEIGGLLPLRVLDLGENSFSGQLPPLGNLTRLEERVNCMTVCRDSKLQKPL